MPLVVWLFIPGAAATMFAILQGLLVILPNGLRLAKLLKEKRPQRFESLRINEDELATSPNAMFAKMRGQFKYYFNDLDFDLPRAAEYKTAVRKGMIRLAASGVVVLVSTISCGAMMFWQR